MQRLTQSTPEGCCKAAGLAYELLGVSGEAAGGKEIKEKEREKDWERERERRGMKERMKAKQSKKASKRERNLDHNRVNSNWKHCRKLIPGN